MYKDADGKVEDSFQAFLVEGASFTKVEEYPIIENWMIPKNPPIKVMPFFKAITCRDDLSEYFIYFYSPDKVFERIRKSPKKYLPFFKRCKGILGFDYSIHTDMPLAKQKSQINDNLSLSYYYAKNGVLLIPNVRGGSDCINEDYLDAFPMHSYLALGVHGFIKMKYQKHEWRVCISTLIKRLEPKGFIVIGHLPLEIIDEYKDAVEFYLFDSFMDERNKEINKHVY
ncbi:MAG: DUF4417 domain-containing protein [Bacilli bacterium]